MNRACRSCAAPRAQAVEEGDLVTVEVGCGHCQLELVVLRPGSSSGLLITWEGLAVEAVSVPSYKGFRFPVEIISHAVWLYHRFPLSFREVEELLLARGIVVSHETVRAWCDRFGPGYAAALRRRRPQVGDKMGLFCSIRGCCRSG